MYIYGTDARDTLAATQAGDTVVAQGGDDLVSSSFEGTTLIGGAGDDVYRLYEADVDVIEEPGGGHDTMWVWRSAEMPEHVEDLEFKGTGNMHYIQGNSLNNVIVSGEGTQALQGAEGDDTLTGGGGDDEFFIELGDGHDVITDFTPGSDILSFWGLGVTSLDDVLTRSTDTNEGTLITFSADQSVLLEGVQRSELRAEGLLLQTLPSDFLDGAKLTFEDTFDDESSLTDGDWNTAPVNGHPVTAAVSYGRREHTYVDENSGSADGTMFDLNPFSVEDGVLSIQAQETPDHLKDDIPEDWVSGQLQTHDKFSQVYGYYEVRAKTPEGTAFWPAVWLTPDNYSWPPEINILEQLGTETHVYRVGAHAPFWGQRVKVNEEHMVPDTSEDFHTYGVLWTPQTLTYTFDGRIMFETETPEGMHEPMALHINLAIGGWQGEPDETTASGATLDIDYVRVYEIPGLTDLPANSDMSAYVDTETGTLNLDANVPDQLYDAEVLRSDDLGQNDLTAEANSTATLVGNAAPNRLEGSDAANVLNGEAGDDTLIGHGGADYLIALEADDSLDGGTGADTLVGGTGDDVYVLRRGDGASVPGEELIIERPGEGIDTLFFEDIRADQVQIYAEWARLHIVITGDTPEYFSLQISPEIGGIDLSTRFERILFADGTSWDLTGGLTLIGDDADNSSTGSSFDDLIEGGEGNDSLFGMDGNDTLDGGHGVDDVYGWNGDDVLTDSGTEGGDRLFGENGNDTIRAGLGQDSAYGGEGDDALYATVDGDALFGQEGNDLLSGRRSADTLDGGTGNDHLFGGGGQDLLFGGAGEDRLSGGDDADLLSGDAGEDTLIGGAGADTLIGGQGQDFLRGGAGVDTFRFVFADIEGDQIMDFESGDRIEIDVTVSGDDVADFALSTEGHNVIVTQISTGEDVFLRAVGATLGDIDLI